MGTAAGKLGHRPCELFYIQTAVAASPKDPMCNRLYALALNDRGMTDQAIVFWHRVEEILPDDHDAKLAMAALTMQKANSRGDFMRLDEVSSKLGVIAKQQEEVTRLQNLQQKIEAEPDNVVNYLELAHLYLSDEQYEDAEDILRQAYEVSGDDLDVREKWEDAQLRRLRQKVLSAENAADKQKFQREYFEKDVECCFRRVERYPDNLRFKFDLGYRYLLTQRYIEAIQQLQIAVRDPAKTGVALLLLGQCFQHVKQYRLAMNHYESAVQQIPERDANNRKSALYLAGRLALAMKDVSTARKHLMTLADLDFGYKDVASLLDGIPYQSTYSENEETEP
jgi:tetratricopeptide (TPR) repeat protein